MLPRAYMAPSSPDENSELTTGERRGDITPNNIRARVRPSIAAGRRAVLIIGSITRRHAPKIDAACRDLCAGDPPSVDAELLPNRAPELGSDQQRR